AFAMRGRPPVATPTHAPPFAVYDAPEVMFQTPQPYTPPPAPAPKPKPKPKPVAKAAASGPNLTAFRGLGAWVDLYDYPKLDPETSIADMHTHRVRTLYLQTGRWNKPEPKASDAFMDPALMERWLVAAHAAGIKVVGWYLPAYDDMLRDI